MIDIVTETEPKMRNLKQIGTPPEEDRIYLLDSAYKQMHENRFVEKSVYVLMGHTEKSNGRYATFVEAAIPVTNIEFERNTPVWSNQVWKEIFTSIKNKYEDLIIVGWGLDLKGFSPRETPELEIVHREQFGGMHQLLFLMNSLEQEEYFFINKNNKLCKKSGFFIYYHVKPEQQERKEVKEEPKVDIEIPEELVAEEHVSCAAKGRYRELLKQQGQTDMGERSRGNVARTREAVRGQAEVREQRISVGLVVAIAMLVVAVGGNAMTHGVLSDQMKSAVETMGQSVNNHVQINGSENKSETNRTGEGKIGGTEDVDAKNDTEIHEENDTEESNTEEAKIPVEEY